MTTYEQDPDVVRWGLHHLLDVCSLPNGSPGSITHYDEDYSIVEYVEEGYCESKHVNVENDEVIAYTLQEELSRLADAEASGSSHDAKEHQQMSILSQDWLGPSKRHGNSGTGKAVVPILSPGGKSVDGEDQSCSPEISDESILDGEVGKRLNQMVPVPHVPKINGEIPSNDEETSYHQRLMDRLQLYDLVELKVLGNGNCQFRSLSDQIYRTTEYHAFVREQIVEQLKSHPELYEGYVPMAFDDYLKKISKTSEWGDHVTLQAAADGVSQVSVTTSSSAYHHPQPSKVYEYKLKIIQKSSPS